jgi:hypothetical protein
VLLGISPGAPRRVARRHHRAHHGATTGPTTAPPPSPPRRYHLGPHCAPDSGTLARAQLALSHPRARGAHPRRLPPRSPLAPCRCAAAASRAPERRNTSEPLESRPFHLGAVEPARCAAAASTRAPHHLGPWSPSTSSATSGAWSPSGSQRQPATRAISEAAEPVHADLRRAHTGPRRTRCAGAGGLIPWHAPPRPCSAPLVRSGPKCLNSKMLRASSRSARAGILQNRSALTRNALA